MDNLKLPINAAQRIYGSKQFLFTTLKIFGIEMLTKLRYFRQTKDELAIVPLVCL